MPVSSREVQAAREEPAGVVLRDQRRGCPPGNDEGSCVVAEEVILHHDRYTDVAHVDLHSPAENARVDVIDIGECLGFPGQIIARVNREENIVYGFTIQNFSGFRLKLFWMYKMASIKKALALMMNVVQTMLWIDSGNRPQRLRA